MPANLPIMPPKAISSVLPSRSRSIWMPLSITARRELADAGRARGAREDLEVRLDHRPHELLEARARGPAEPLVRLGRVADERDRVRRSHEIGVDHHVG